MVGVTFLKMLHDAIEIEKDVVGFEMETKTKTFYS